MLCASARSVRAWIADEAFGGDSARVDRHVDERGAGHDAIIARVARARIRGIGVRAQVRHAAADRGLRAVAVVVVEVEHEHALALAARVGARGDRGVVEDAETHAARGLGVMSGRAHERERAAASVDGRLERDERRADGARGAFVRARVDQRVAGDQLRDAVGFQRGARAAHELDVRGRMHARDLVGARDARVDALAEHPAPAKLVGDDAHAIGPLGMRDAAQVRGEAVVVRDEHRVTSWTWPSAFSWRPARASSAGGRSRR